VILAFGLVKLMVLEGLEMQRNGEIERMVGNTPPLGRRGSSHVPTLKVRNLSKATNFSREQIAFCRSKVLTKPEEYVVDEHRIPGTMQRSGTRENSEDF
jgi:hypothetical protein